MESLLNIERDLLHLELCKATKQEKILRDVLGTTVEMRSWPWEYKNLHKYSDKELVCEMKRQDSAV